MSEKYTIGIVGKEIFYQRMSIEKELGDALYEQIIGVLEFIGKECKTSKIADYRLGVYLDSKNPESRHFELGEKQFYFICDHFGHNFYKKIKEFAKREQIKGTDILFQLNAGNISAKDFADRL